MKSSDMKEIPSHSYSSTENQNISGSDYYKGNSYYNFSFSQAILLNTENQNLSKRKMKSKNKKTVSKHTDLVESSDCFLSRVAIDLNVIPFRRDLQIVIMGDSLGASLSKTEIIEIQQLLINSINDVAHLKPAPELKFHSSMLLRAGWILLNCHNESTFQWVFFLSAMSGKSFNAVEASVAPWKPVRVYITISGMGVDVNALVKLLIGQNLTLRLDTWKYLETHKVNESLYLHFLVPSDGVRLLEISLWKVHFMLEMLTVSVVEELSRDISLK